jgi:hypothetical protein
LYEVEGKKGCSKGTIFLDTFLEKV